MKNLFTLHSVDGPTRRLTRRARETLANLGFVPRPTRENDDRLRCIDHVEQALEHPPGTEDEEGT